MEDYSKSVNKQVTVINGRYAAYKAGGELKLPSR